MSKMLDSNNISTGVPKMIETPDHFIINGQVYGKNSLIPKPFNTIYVNNENYYDMFTYRHAMTYKSSEYCTTKSEANCIIDSQDPDTFYFVTDSISGGNYGVYKCKVNENEKVEMVKPYMGVFIGSAIQALTIVGQDTQYIYVKSYYNNETGCTYYIRYNKTDLTYTVLCSTSLMNDYTFYDNQNYFFSIGNTSGGITTCKKISKTDGKQIIVSNADDNTSNMYFSVTQSKIDENNNMYGIKHTIDSNKIQSYSYMKYHFNKTTEMLTTTSINVDYSKCNDNIYNPSTLSNSRRVVMEFIRFTDNITNKNYITHIIYCRSDNITTFLPNSSKFFTYEIIDEDNWKFVSSVDLDDIVYRAFLDCYNGKMLCFANQIKTVFFSWNTESEKYIKTESFDAPTKCIGTDMNNNVYVQFIDGSIEIVSTSVATTVLCDYESDNYNYIGSNIDTNVIVYAKNVNNNFVNCQLEIQLTGPVQFSDDNSKRKIISTSPTSQIKIPVTIKDAGNLRVSARIV